MNENLKNQANSLADEPIVIPDECGDSMWDAVLAQEVKACDVKEISKNSRALFSQVNTRKSVNRPPENSRSTETK